MAKKKERRTVHVEELVPRAVIDLMNESTDLACALICGAYIENATGSLLERNMIDDALANGPDGILNRPTGILSTASGRSDLCYCLGLIDKAVHSNAKAIATVRNYFAHSTKPIDFSDRHVKAECETLHVAIGDPKDVGVFAGQLGVLEQSFRPVKPLDKKTVERILADPRHRLVLGTCWTLLVLTQSVYALKSMEEAVEATFYSPKNIDVRFEAAVKKGKKPDEALREAMQKAKRPEVFESKRSFLVTHEKEGKLFFDTVPLLDD